MVKTNKIIKTALLPIHQTTINNKHNFYELFSAIFLFSSFKLAWSCVETAEGGAVRVNMTGILDKSGLPCFSSSLIQDRRESLEEVPGIFKCYINKQQIIF